MKKYKTLVKESRTKKSFTDTEPFLLYKDIMKQAEVAAKELNKLEKLIDSGDKLVMADILRDATNAIRLKNISARDALFTSKMIALEISSYLTRIMK